MKERISIYISYDEATASSTAEHNKIDNTPSPELIENGKNIGTKIFDKLREHFGCRIAITSFFRSPEVNKILEKNPSVVASKKSQHMTFEAMDINGSVFGGVTNRQIFDWIRENLEFDQLIWEDVEGDQEPEWIHVSLKNGDNVKQRMEVLKRTRINGVTKYEKL